MRLPVYERRAGVSPLSMPQVQAAPQVGDNGETAAKTLHGVFTRLEEIQNGMEDARTLELFNRFKMDSQEYHENPDRGIYNTRLGYHASGIYQEADQWLRKKGEDYARELPSRRAQFNFRKMAREHIQQRGMQNSRFEANQVKKYQQETADAAIKERLNYAESHWNDDAAIAQVRRDVQQALELKMRGSGKEAFDAAMMDIEDQIGIARIRQAVVQSPLLGVDMLNNPDIKLKADTRAKVTEQLRNRTEIYRMHGIVQEYAKHYSSENAVEAQKVLIERYGPDEGQKAFAALVRHWGIQRSQDSAREQNLRKQQESHENQILDKWNEFLSGQSDTMPDVTELTKRAKNGEIRREFAIGMIQRVINKLEEKQKKHKEAEKQFRDKIIFAAESNGQFFSDEELTQMVGSDTITDDEARAAQARRRAYFQRQEQEENKRFEDNRQNFIAALLDGTLTDEMIDRATGSELKPEDARIIKGYLQTERERKEAEQRRDAQEAERLRKKAQEKYEGALGVIIGGTGGRISKEQATELYDAGKIGESFRDYLYSRENQHQRDEERALSEQAKQQATADEEALKKKLDSIAQQYAMMYYENQGSGLRLIDSQEFMPELSTKQREYLREQFNKHSHDINTEAKNYKDKHEEFEKKLHENRMRLYEGDFHTREEIAQARKNIQEALDLGLKYEYYKQEKDILDEKERKLDKAQAEADKKQKAADELTHAQEIERWGTDIYNRYKEKGKGDALKYVDTINIPDPKIRQKVRERVSRLFEDDAQIIKDQKDKTQQAADEIYEDMSLDILRRSLSNEEIAQYRKTVLDMRENRQIDEQKYNGLISILDDMQRANDQTAKLKQKQDDFDAGKNLALKHGLSGQHDGRRYIRENYPDEAQYQNIMSAFNGFIQDMQREQNTKDKALSDQQDKTYQDIVGEIRRTGQAYDSEKLFKLEQSEGIKFEQAERIRILNEALTTRQGIEDFYRKNNINNFNSMGYSQQQAMISDYQGITQDQRQANVAAYLDRAAEGKLTASEIDWAEKMGYIEPDDADYLRNYNSNFDRHQKDILDSRRREMQKVISDLYKHNRTKSHIWNNASVDFLNQTAMLDLRSPNFAENVDKIIKGIMQPILDEFAKEKTLEEYQYGLFGELVPSKAGLRHKVAQDWMKTPTQTQQPHMYYRDAQGNISTLYTSGGTQSADTPAPVPEQSTPQAAQQEAPQGFWGKAIQTANEALTATLEIPPDAAQNIQPAQPTQPVTPPQTARPQNSSEVMQSIAPSMKVSISSGYSEQPTALRDGRAHRAFDWKMPVGTWLYPPKYSQTWRVLQTGENSKAGKFIKLQTTTASGDVDVHTYAHLSSIDVKAGDVISSGDVVAKSGNTGHTTGAHLHWGMQRNGQAVNPTKINDWNGNSSGDVQRYAPVPVAPPIVSTDQQIFSAMDQAISELFNAQPQSYDILFGLSGDILYSGGSLF